MMNETDNSIILGGIARPSRTHSLTARVGGLTDKTEEIIRDLDETKKDLHKHVRDLESNKQLVTYGFLVLLVMVATMIFMVASMLIEALKSEKDIVYVEKGVSHTPATKPEKSGLGVWPPFR